MRLLSVIALTLCLAGAAAAVAEPRSSSDSQEPAVLSALPCVDCPPGAQQEGEPPCVDEYRDDYNSGCGGTSYRWTPLVPDASGCATMCAKSCTFLFDGLSYRDSDWFDCVAAGGQVTASCQAEFPILFMFMYNPVCYDLRYDYVFGDACETVTLSRTIPAGEHVWLWVAPSAFTGVPEQSYVLEACGLLSDPMGVPEPEPAEAVTWGRIKIRFAP